jgi:acid stress chaperone HdeB
MRKFSIVAAVLSCFLDARGASAQVIDMSSLKCAEFLKSGADNIGVLLMWLSGYFANDDEQTTVDFAKMKQDGVKIAAYCKEHPTSGLLDAAERALGRVE